MENYVICMEHWDPLITKMFLIKTLKYWNSATILNTQITSENILIQNYNFYLMCIDLLLEKLLQAIENTEKWYELNTSATNYTEGYIGVTIFVQ